MGEGGSIGTGEEEGRRGRRKNIGRGFGVTREQELGSREEKHGRRDAGEGKRAEKRQKGGGRKEKFRKKKVR